MEDEDIPTAAGLSSFNLLDERKLFAALELSAGMTMLDLGCGLGNYTVAASPRVGGQGVIHAFDPWAEGIETLAVRAEIGGLHNIRAEVVSAGHTLPLAEGCVDLCLMATVIHILAREEGVRHTMAEVRRVLKPAGILAVVEFHKVEGPPGPPLSWRLAPAELELLLAPYGFRNSSWVDVGPCNYLSLFHRSE